MNVVYSVIWIQCASTTKACPRAEHGGKHHGLQYRQHAGQGVVHNRWGAGASSQAVGSAPGIGSGLGGILDVPAGRGSPGRFQGFADSGTYDGAGRILPAPVLHSADPDDPGIKQVIETIGDDNVVVASDFGHAEGRHYSRAVDEVMSLPGVSEASKHKIMWDNALKLCPIKPH
jgi:hypothetical protein